MLKHTFHARLSIWHLVLLVIILWLTHFAFTKQGFNPVAQTTTTQSESTAEPQNR